MPIAITGKQTPSRDRVDTIHLRYRRMDKQTDMQFMLGIPHLALCAYRNEIIFYSV